MSGFASLFEYGDKGISEDKKCEFKEKVEKLFQCGGMMESQKIQLYDREVITIHKAKMKSNCMDLSYNYFEDDFWERAGFSSEYQRVWSNKIGWTYFHDTIVAAYVLEEQYTEDIAVAMDENYLVTSWRYVGWLNYLFNEQKHVRNYDALTSLQDIQNIH